MKWFIFLPLLLIANNAFAIGGIQPFQLNDCIIIAEVVSTPEENKESGDYELYIHTSTPLFFLYFSSPACSELKGMLWVNEKILGDVAVGTTIKTHASISNRFEPSLSSEIVILESLLEMYLARFLISPIAMVVSVLLLGGGIVYFSRKHHTKKYEKY